MNWRVFDICGQMAYSENTKGDRHSMMQTDIRFICAEAFAVLL